jgi:riboflavin synthase
VQGHVDSISTVLAVTPGEAWRVVRFSLSPEIASLVTRKGSIAVDGVSLTVSAVSDPGAPQQWFEVSLIPETLAATTLGGREVGDRVNVETDILARHVERMLALEQASPRHRVSDEGRDADTSRVSGASRDTAVRSEA